MVAPITAEQLREWLIYEPETGLFRYRVPRGRMPKGTIAGTVREDFRVDINLGGRVYRASRLAWLYMTGGWPQYEVDHRDCVPSNNIWTNLRDVTSTVNKQNIRRAQSNKKHSPLLGAQRVSNRPGLWKSQITVNGRRIALGCFHSDVAAHEAYIRAKRELHEGCTI